MTEPVRARRETTRLSVVAVIVTFSAPDDLLACVNALRSQTRRPDQILVIDNAGTPAAHTILSGISGVDVHTMPANTGPAGGFAAGFQLFSAGRHDFIWAMDDDVIPDPHCLEALLSDHESDPARLYLRPVIRGPNDETITWPGWYGVLIGRHAVESVGQPWPDWVWFYEDTDYLQRRLPTAGFERFQSRTATAVHVMSRRADHKPGWKLYYETRNAIYYRLRVQRGQRWQKLVRTLAKTALRIAVKEDDRWHKATLFCRGMWDGIRGRMGITVALPTRVASDV